MQLSGRSPVDMRAWGSATNPAIVLLHGLYGKATDWIPIAQLLESSYRVLAFCLPCHADGMVDDAPTLVSMAARIAEGVLSGGVERCVVVGHSLGGRVAMQLAMDYPGLVAAVVSIDAPPPTFSMPRVESMMQERIARLAAAWQSQAGCGRLAMKLFMLKSYQCRCYEGEPARIDFPEHCPSELPEAVADFILRSYVQGQEGWRWLLYWPGISTLILNGIGYRERLPFVQPLLLLKGGASSYCTGVTEELLRSRGVAEHCRVVQFAGEGHFLHIHRRGEMVELLKTLLPWEASRVT